MADAGRSIENDMKGVDPLSDLIANALQGDSPAFECIYRLYVGRIYALCLRLVADPVRAEGLVQDVFVRVWKKLGTYGGRGSFAGWIRRLAVNVVIEDCRAEARQARWLEQESGAPRASQPDTGGEIDLERSIAALPEGARVAFVLHDIEGYRHREIAEIGGVTEGTIKAQLHRARKLLREALSELPEGKQDET